MVPMEPDNPPLVAPTVEGVPPVLEGTPPSEAQDATRGLLGATVSMVAFRAVSTLGLVLVSVITARQLQPQGRGVLVLLVAIASFGVLLSSLGVNVAARVHLVAPMDRIECGDYLGLAGTLTVLQMVVCAALGLILLPLVKVTLSFWMLGLFALLGASLLGQYMLNDALNAYGHTTMATSVEAGGSALQLVLVLFLAVSDEQRISAFVGALIVANGAQVVAGLAVLRSRQVAVWPRYNRIAWRRLLRSGLPGIPTALGQLLTFRIDRYLVGLFLSPAAVGIYSVAATAPEMLRLPSLALGQPILYRLASGSARPEHFRRIRMMCMALTVAMAAVVFALAPFAVRVVFGPEYLGAVTPLRVLLLGEAGIAVFYLDGAVLMGTNRLRHVAVAAMSGLAVVVLLDVGLIPRFGLAGAAWASVAAYSAMGVLAAVLVRRAITSP